MWQSRLGSLIESITNVAIWYSVAVISQILIFPLFGINISVGDNLLIGLYFTLISIVRSYLIRRYYENRK